MTTPARDQVVGPWRPYIRCGRRQLEIGLRRWVRMRGGIFAHTPFGYLDRLEYHFLRLELQ